MHIKGQPLSDYHSFSTHSFIGASLSEPHTSVISLHPCVCMFACLDRPLTANLFWLLFCVVYMIR